MSVDNYMVSLQQIMIVPGVQDECQKADLEMRARLDAKELTQTRDEIKQIYWQLKKEEAEVDKMSRGTENGFLILVEKTKIYDKMYLDTGIKIHWIQESAKSHDLDNDCDICEWKQASIMEAKLKEDKIAEDNQLTEWFKENSKSLIEDLGENAEAGMN